VGYSVTSPWATVCSPDPQITAARQEYPAVPEAHRGADPVPRAAQFAPLPATGTARPNHRAASARRGPVVLGAFPDQHRLARFVDGSRRRSCRHPALRDPRASSCRVRRSRPTVRPRKPRPAAISRRSSAPWRPRVRSPAPGSPTPSRSHPRHRRPTRVRPRRGSRPRGPDHRRPRSPLVTSSLARPAAMRSRVRCGPRPRTPTRPGRIGREPHGYRRRPGSGPRGPAPSPSRRIPARKAGRPHRSGPAERTIGRARSPRRPVPARRQWRRRWWRPAPAEPSGAGCWIAPGRTAKPSAPVGSPGGRSPGSQATTAASDNARRPPSFFMSGNPASERSLSSREKALVHLGQVLSPAG
jgi:hypothetical protein